MSHRLCCCLGDITCEEWCECLPDVCTIDRIEIVRTRTDYDYNNQVAFEYTETIRLLNVNMQFLTDGCKCWMENLGGRGNGQIEHEFRVRSYIKFCSTLDSQGCAHECFPPLILHQTTTFDANLQSLGAGMVKLECDDPCNPCLNPCNGCPSQTFNMLYVDATVNGTETFTDTCNPGSNYSYSLSWPVRASFIARNGCLTSSTYNTRGLRVYNDNAWQASAFPVIAGLFSVCSGDQKFGWTCGGVGPVFVTNPQYESYYEVETCQVGACRGHTCYSTLGPPAVPTYQCVCNGPGDPGYTYNWSVFTRSHDVQITV